MNTSIPALIMLVVYFVVIRVLRAGAAKKAGAKKRTDETQTVPRRHIVPAARIARRESEEFDYGKASHEYSHVSQKRLEQVNSYLKAGLIDKKEYYQMLERYSRQENCFDDQ